MTGKNFAIVGCAGFVAPRHLQAIKDTGNILVAALDKSDSVGIIDKYFDDVSFFTEFERFDRHIEKLRRKGPENKIHFVSICSPNYLHDAHIRFAFRIGADAICEKPLVLNPWNLDALEELEKETGKKVYGILQLRLHPVLIALKNKIDREYNGKKYEVDLRYITPRGKWYLASWKGDVEKSGGVATNLGIHFFDALMWIFGTAKNYEVDYASPKKIEGKLELEKANVKWYLSTDKEDVPEEARLAGKTAYRSMKVNGEEIEFSEGFENLHTKSYEEILAGRGFGIKDVRSSVDLVSKIRNSISSTEYKSPHYLNNSNKLENPPIRQESSTYIHSSSSIDENTLVGEGTKIWHFSHVLPGSKIGKNCTIGQNVMMGPDVSIGNNCKIQNNVSIFKGISFEDKVFCGPSVVFTNVLNPRSFIDRKKEFIETRVLEGATIGANSTIVCGSLIGRYSFIGAGAVVTKDVPDYALFIGVPAKHSGWVCKCGVKLSKEVISEKENILICENCGSKYKHYQDKFTPLEEKV